jgi:hypothetical protein
MCIISIFTFDYKDKSLSVSFSLLGKIFLLPLILDIDPRENGMEMDHIQPRSQKSLFLHPPNTSAGQCVSTRNPILVSLIKTSPQARKLLSSYDA